MIENDKFRLPFPSACLSPPLGQVPPASESSFGSAIRLTTEMSFAPTDKKW